MGGPALVARRQRSCKLRFSGPSNSSPRASAARSACRFCASGVSGGIFPSGGSVIKDVRRSGTTFPRSRPNSLYARPTSAPPPTRPPAAVAPVAVYVVNRLLLKFGGFRGGQRRFPGELGGTFQRGSG